MEGAYCVAGIDVHKKMLAVVVANVRETELRFECRRFGTTVSELRNLSAWLQAHTVQEVVMESTAQYWKPVWLAWEGNFSSGWHKHGRTEVLVGARRTFEMPNAVSAACLALI
jgi:hypothetical protein